MKKSHKSRQTNTTRTPHAQQSSQADTGSSITHWFLRSSLLNRTATRGRDLPASGVLDSSLKLLFRSCIRKHKPKEQRIDRSDNEANEHSHLLHVCTCPHHRGQGNGPHQSLHCGWYCSLVLPNSKPRFGATFLSEISMIARLLFDAIYSHSDASTVHSCYYALYTTVSITALK